MATAATAPLRQGVRYRDPAREPETERDRFEIAATPVDGGRFNHIRRTLSDGPASRRDNYVLESNATLAEQAGERWAKRWIDLNASATR